MSQVTKRAIEQSLKHLLQEKPLNKITISDIAEDCGINRMTFYYHFKDIYDLVEWICTEDARKALAEQNSDNTWQEGLLRIFRMALENKPFLMNVYRCIRQEQVEKYLKPLVDNLVLGIIRQEIGTMTVLEADQAFIARVYAYIIIGVILDWIREDMATEPEKIVEKLSCLLQGTITQALDRFKISSFSEI